MSSYICAPQSARWDITTNMYPCSIDFNAADHADVEEFSARSHEKRSPLKKGGSSGSTGNSTNAGDSAGAIVDGAGTTAPFAIMISLLATLGLLGI